MSPPRGKRDRRGRGRPPGGGGGRGGRGGRDGRGGRRNAPESYALPLPKETDAAVPGRPREGDNLGLWLDRFLRRSSTTWEIKDDHRAGLLGAFERRWKSSSTVDVLARRIAPRGSVPTNKPVSLQPGRWHLRAEIALHGPMIVDYGRVSVLESSLAFDRLLGVPRIPGSALKGVARAHGMQTGITDERSREIFGEPGQAGMVSFFDALPRNGSFSLALDVLTPHFGDYYQGKSPPGDWLSPVPTTFLAVVDTTFVFDLEIEARSGDRRIEHAEILADAGTLLAGALADQGVGAKTAAGYGWFGGAG